MNEDDKKRMDTLAEVMDGIGAVRLLAGKLAPSRAVALVLTKLDEAEMWALREIADVMKKATAP